ncbi:hypothetical protein Q1695_003339 [Nippostrongylus brasiliensis]|nr:hypothetical protein Q1695_003339 [Nippostrongylus brasiliensis]
MPSPCSVATNNTDLLVPTSMLPGLTPFQNGSEGGSVRPSVSVTAPPALPSHTNTADLDDVILECGIFPLIKKDRDLEAAVNDPPQALEWNKRFPDGTIVVYTDGSGIGNRASGFGIYFGRGHVLNRSQIIPGREHSSGRAEIIAAQVALRRLRNWDGYRNEPVILRTDYLPLVNAMRDSSKGRFAREYEKVRELALRFPKGVAFEHVHGHDDHLGNQEADRLAREATEDARQTRSASARVFGRRVHQQTTVTYKKMSRSMSRPKYTRNAYPIGKPQRKINRESRERSRNNDALYVQSHSAFVAGRRGSDEIK